jgi:hypothetical protein
LRHHRALRSAGWLAAMAMVALAFLVPAAVMAWTPPTITPLCAPDANSYAFTVNLDTNTWDNSGYQFEWAFGSTMPDAGWTGVVGNVGDNSLVTPRGTGKLWVRWTVDHSSFASATPDGDLCVSPSPSPSESASQPAQSESASPSPSPSESASQPAQSESLPPSHDPSTSPSSKPSGSVLAETGTPQLTPPATDTVAAAPGSGGSGLPMLLAAATILLLAVFAATPSRKRNRR